LCKKRIRLEVTDFENVGTAFGRRRYNFRRMNFGEVLYVKYITEEFTNTGHYPVNGLIGWRAQVNDTVI
jgi:hypothetical protein